MSRGLKNHKGRHDFALEAIGFAPIGKRVIPGDVEIFAFMTRNAFDVTGHFRPPLWVTPSKLKFGMNCPEAAPGSWIKPFSRPRERA